METVGRSSKRILSIISSYLSLAEFLIFGYVCKVWRNIFKETKQKFMESQPPLASCITTKAKKSCNFYDIFSRIRSRTKLPYPCMYWLGISSEYLIFEDIDSKVCLLNPVTGQEMKLPSMPQPNFIQLSRYGQAIVASIASCPGHVLIVVLSRANLNINLCFWFTGDNQWRRNSSERKPGLIWDTVVFKGKIFALTCKFQIGILDLSSCNLLILELNGTPSLSINARFGASEDRLLVVDHGQSRQTKVYWIDFWRNEWIEMEDLGDKSVFIGYTMCSRLGNVTQWGGRSNCVYLPEFISKTCSVLSLNGEMVKSFPICRDYYSPRINFSYFLNQTYNMDIVDDDSPFVV